MYILFAGDSYCYHDEKNITWVDRVCDQLSAQYHRTECPGMSWWSTRRQILGFIKKFPQSNPKYRFDLVIWCHTDPYRIISRHDEAFNLVTVEKNYKSNEIYQTAKNYMDNIWDMDHALWEHQHWLNECESLIPTAKHLHLYSYLPVVPHDIKGTVVLPSLYAISTCEPLPVINSEDHRMNHLTYRNNMALADQVVDIIKNKMDQSIVNLDLSEFELKSSNTVRHWEGFAKNIAISENQVYICS